MPLALTLGSLALGGRRGGLPSLPAGFAYVVLADGRYLTQGGAYLIVEIV